MKKDQSGFTLVETIVVLFITSALIVLPVLSFNRIIETIQIELYFRELASDITAMQNYTILTGNQTRITFAPEKNVIVYQIAHDPGHPLVREEELNNQYCQLRASVGLITMSFTRNAGNIDSSRTIAFDTTRGRYNLTYLLGSGKFDVKKVDK